MRRREFLKSLLAGGVLVNGSALTLSNASAAVSDQLFVFVGADGGWDITSICDPKGAEVTYNETRGPMNHYAAAAIRQAGNIPYAPLSDEIVDPEQDWLDVFFQRHYQRLTVFNGVDHQTNSHSNGKRAFFAGTDDLGIPAFGALVAVPYVSTQPLAFFDGGGYSKTEGIVPASRVTGIDLVNRLGNPNPYLPPEVFDQINVAKDAQLADLISRASTDAQRLTLLKLRDARQSSQSLGALLSYLPEETSSGLKLNAEIASAAFAAGLATSANLSFGGFDSHGGNDVRQHDRLGQLLDGVDHLWSELTRLGLADRTTIVIGSDFGRTPWFNEDNGKDHWPIGSVMVMGEGIPGNRVIGATDNQLKPRPVNASTFEFDDNGVVLTPAHIHKSLRRLAGISSSNPLTQRFPLQAPELNLFG